MDGDFFLFFFFLDRNEKESRILFSFSFPSTDYPSWRKFSSRAKRTRTRWKRHFRRLSRPVFSHLTGFKTTFTLFPLVSSRVCLVSRRLLTRTAEGAGVRLRKIAHHPYLFGRGRRLWDQVSLSFRSSFSSEEVCLSDNERSFWEREARACSAASSQPRKMAGRSLLSTSAMMRFFEICPRNSPISPNTRARHVSGRGMKETALRGLVIIAQFSVDLTKRT